MWKRISVLCAMVILWGGNWSTAQSVSISGSSSSRSAVGGMGMTMMSSGRTSGTQTMTMGLGAVGAVPWWAFAQPPVAVPVPIPVVPVVTERFAAPIGMQRVQPGMGFRFEMNAPGPWGGNRPGPAVAAPRDPNLNVAEPRRPQEPGRADRHLTIGDRLFRADQLSRAVDRYRLARNAEPLSAAPRIRMAQVEIVRGNYHQAVDHIRDAITADPDWILQARSIQGLYAGPAEFHRVIAQIEAHLQVEPNDRDAWLVLGTQWYLSGRTQQAADVFLRLTDRKPDATLAALLEASRAGE